MAVRWLRTVQIIEVELKINVIYLMTEENVSFSSTEFLRLLSQKHNYMIHSFIKNSFTLDFTVCPM